MEKIFLILLILLLYFFILVLLIYSKYSSIIRQQSKETYDKTNNIPKIIWTYWHETEKPVLINKCYLTWVKHNPDYIIRCLNKKNYKEYAPELEVDNFESVTKFSDFLRFLLVSKYGGVWMDATIICNTSLNNILRNECEFTGYFIPNFTILENYPVIENYFLASTANSDFMIKWKQEVFRSLDFKNQEEYVENVRKSGYNLQQIPYPEYLSCHVAAQVILQNETINKFNIFLINTVSDVGPFYYLNENNWDSEKALASLCKKEFLTPLIKLRGIERNHINQFMSCLFTNDYN